MVLNILQWNIRGYSNNYTNLQLLISDKKPDIICLQETRCKNNYTPITPKEYIGYFFNPNITAKQGTAILIKKNIPHKVLNTNLSLNVIGLEIKSTISFTILSLYFPPQDSLTIDLLNNLIININTPLFLVGDFNAWSPLWGSPTCNKKGKILEKFLTDSNLATLNDGSATHLSTHNTFTHIDLSIVSLSIVPMCRWNIINDLFNSDHYPIELQILIGNNIRQPYLTKFNTKRANWDIYRDKISQFSDLINISDNVNKEAASIRKIIRLSANESIPLSSKIKRAKSVPWWSPELQKLRNEKQLSWKQFRRNMSTENLILYKRNNAIFNRAKKLAKTKSFNEFTENLNPTTPSKILWQDIRKLTGNYTPNTIKTISLNGKTVTNPHEISEAFAKYWSDNSRDTNFSTNFQIQKSQTLHSLEVTTCPPRSREIEQPFNMQEMLYSLNTSKGKTPGLDKISYPMLKNLPDSFKIRILKLFNQIFDLGIIPQYFKTASVVAIHKNNKPIDNIDSYRPISLLPCITKLLEKMISRRLMWFIKKHKLLSKNQIGFQSGLSTIDALMYLDHIICKNRSTKNHTSILSIDFIKAFDKIGVHIVLQKLAKWSIGPKTFKLIKSFLINRKFSVRVNNNFSDIFSLHNGIPQGSPLSVTLFIIAFDDLSRIIDSNKKVDHCIYADDLYVIAREQSNDKIKQAFTKTLQDIANWSKTSGADVSVEKTNHLHICRKHNCRNIDMFFNNINIKNVDNCKILGLNIDRKYSFKNHCNYLKNALTSKLNIIKYLASAKSLMHTNSLLRLAKSTILGKINYGLVVYSKASKSIFKPIQNILNASIRASLRAFRTTPIKNLQAEGGFEPLRIHANKLKFRLIHKIFCSNSSLLYRHISLLKKRKTELKYPSTLAHIFKMVQKFNIQKYKPPSEIFPPWKLDESTFVKKLQIFNKNNTAPAIFKSLFNEVFTEFKKDNWHFIFTDGSKTTNHVGFAVTNESGSTQISGILSQNANIFEAEAEAISQALKLCKANSIKNVICTDSRSVFDAALNPRNRNETIISIQQLLIKLKNRVKLCWIPSHIGILGNEAADKAAKNTQMQPTYLHIPPTKNYISRLTIQNLDNSIQQKWGRYRHIYQTINPCRTPIVLPNSTNTHKNKCFTRLRLTHTRLTHQYLLTKDPQPVCTFCNNASLTIMHLLTECQTLHSIRLRICNSNSILDLLKYPSEDNINKMYDFLQHLNLQNKI